MIEISSNLITVQAGNFPELFSVRNRKTILRQPFDDLCL